MKTLFGLLGSRPPPVAEKPLRDELLSIERLEERAQALAARLHARPEPPAHVAERPAALRRQRPRPARGLRHHGRRRAPGGVRHPRGGMAPRQLPSRGLRDPRRAPEPSARLLPRAAQARLAGARGRRPRLRHGRGADPPQRQPPGPAAARALHEQLPGRGPAHDRRAVGLAEHAEAGPHREPAGGSRRRRSRPARRVRAADAYVARIDAAGHGRPPPLPGTSTPATSFSSSSACASTAPAFPPSAPPSTRTSPPSR